MDKGVRALSQYRTEQAKQCIESAKLLMDAGDYKGAANWSYYAIFHAMRSVLALEKVDFSKHSGVSAYFRKTYIKTGIFDVEMSDIISLAFEARSDSDYDDFYVISKEEVEEQIANAHRFCEAVQGYLQKKDIDDKSTS